MTGQVVNRKLAAQAEIIYLVCKNISCPADNVAISQSLTDNCLSESG